MQLNWFRLSLLALLTFAGLASKPMPSSNKYLLYVGVYGKGIYAFRYDAATTKLDSLGLVGDVTNPSFLASDPAQKYLYAVSELEGDAKGAVAAFQINHTTGNLTFLNSQSSDGLAPCHLAVDHTGKMLVAANYTSGDVPSFPIDANGKLGPMASFMRAHGSGPDKGRQEGPHAHETVISSDNKLLYVPDLGLDQIRIYNLDTATAKLTPHDPPHVKEEGGLGPRHLAFSPDEKFAYVINELKPVVTVFSHDAASGIMTHIQTVSSVQQGFSGVSNPAEILLDRAGKFVYASNRGPGTIAVFSVDPSSGKLTQIQVAETGGTVPRGVEFDPTGHVLFAGDQKANRFVTFNVDAQTGKLTLTGNSYEVPSPVAFLFVPAE